METQVKYHSEWYARNRERLLPIRRKYNEQYTKRPEVIEAAREKNATSYFKKKRKEYKKSLAGKQAETRYRKKHWDAKALVREKRLLWRYGLTPESYRELLEKQGGKCAICLRDSEKRLHVDHSHETKRVRGLLCGNCNRGIGMFYDNPALIGKAIEYLNVNNPGGI